MIDVEKDDLFYVCMMIEYVARHTKNTTRDIVKKISDDELRHQLKAACVNHCLTFEQVCDEWIEDFGITNGSFDNISQCRYTVPTETSIGRLYQMLIFNVADKFPDIVSATRAVYDSFMSDEISDFNTSFYYGSPDYLKWCFLEGKVLDY